MKRKEINLALLVDQNQEQPKKKQTFTTPPWRPQTLPMQAQQTLQGEQQQSRPPRKEVNLALLLDKPRQTMAQPQTIRQPQQQQQAMRPPQQTMQPRQAMQPQKHIDDDVEEPAGTYSVKVAYSLPFFQIPGLRWLSEMPRVLETKEEVHAWCDIPKMLVDIRPSTLAQCNGNPLLFPGITFLEKPHEYWLSQEIYFRLKQVDDVKADPTKWDQHKFNGSVTKVAGKCFSPFIEADSIGCIQGGKNYNTPEYEYYQMTPVQISNQFLAANLLGTLLHYMIELFFNGYGSCIPPQLKDKSWRQFERFYIKEIEGKYVPYLTEMRVYDLNYDLAGSIDFICVRINEWLTARRESRPPRLVVMDWKRTKKFDQKAFTGEMAAPPLQNFPSTNLHKYTVQLNLYKYIIEANSPFTVDEMFLCRFHPSQETYEMRPVQVCKKEIEDLLALRKAEMQVARAAASATTTMPAAAIHS